jgi:septum formation protein
MALWLAPDPLVVASRSAVRRAMLDAAGIPLVVFPADVDERALEARNPTATASEVALMLAREKARVVAARFPGYFVLGADQTLVLGDRRFTKPADLDAAREQLRALSGRTHELHSAVVIIRDGRTLFSHSDIARMTVRSLSERFIANYIEVAGDAVTESVGAYQLEKLGVHLFERVEGDHFTVLGLPLLPLLAFLRRERCLDS